MASSTAGPAAGAGAAAATRSVEALGKRVALVIGNGAYKAVDPLSNPANDAAAPRSMDAWATWPFDSNRTTRNFPVYVLPSKLNRVSVPAPPSNVALSANTERLPVSPATPSRSVSLPPPNSIVTRPSNRVAEPRGAPWASI